MQVKFLGTAAAEGWPAIFCNCESCNKAREKGGKNLRTRSSCLIDEEYMVDFSADTYYHVCANHLDLTKVRHLLVTHSHNDHFYPEDLDMRKEPYGHLKNEFTLMVYGNEAVKARFELADVEEDHKNRVAFQQLEPFRTYRMGEADVTPVLAQHMPNEQCFLYILSKAGKTLLYGHDTGIFPDETWEYLKKIRLDLVILDCTHGAAPVTQGHMGIPAVLETKRRLEQMNSADENTTFVITHFSHNGGLLQDELEAAVAPYHILVAYDGMELTV